MITTNQIRQKYINYFESHRHQNIPSALLLPENDSTTLFNSSGMQPLVPYLLGEKHSSGQRLVNSQKCLRTQDIEAVGDNRHTTFFEMLGNWSLGDYFKTEQIAWIFNFVVRELGLDPKRLFITVFRGNTSLGIPRDEEAVCLWQEQFALLGIAARDIDFAERDGLGGGQIFYYDEKKNWWSRSGEPDKMPIGEPGGPDTEMFWDFGEKYRYHERSNWKNQPCHVNCDCGRFLEIGNSVFMQYMKTAEGFQDLSQKNVDFGGGLERMAAAVNDDPDIFHIDLFKPMRQRLEKISGKSYGNNPNETKAFRIIMDHLRAATFLIADGAPPGNKDQGYFTRRLVRRAVRFADQINIVNHACPRVAEAVIETYQEQYPSLEARKEEILFMMQEEEEKFRKTLRDGLRQFVDRMKNRGETGKISGQEAFDLYQTYGFPIEVTVELAHERGFTVDLAVFEEEQKKHQTVSKQGVEQKFKGGLADHSDMSVKYHTATHLLHAALRAVLGPLALQKGSNITPERLRFDFIHETRLTEEEKKRVESLVNGAIARNYCVSWQEMSVAEAKAMGAIGLFGDTYADRIKVYTVGDPDHLPEPDPRSPTFSREICGGPHVTRTGVLGKNFRIVKEESCGAEVRRIKAVLDPL